MINDGRVYQHLSDEDKIELLERNKLGRVTVHVPLTVHEQVKKVTRFFGAAL